MLIDSGGGGGMLFSTDGYIGNSSTGAGTVTVTGTSSTWYNGDMGYGIWVGVNGTGTLNVTNGGAVTDYGYLSAVGYSDGSTGIATVTGPGSTWTTAAEYFYIGGGDGAGNGTLNITNGGVVGFTGYDPYNPPAHDLYAYIGSDTGSSGTVTVTGADSQWNLSGEPSTLFIGMNGTGRLNITAGGSVTVNGATYVGYLGMSGVGTIDFGAGGGTLTTQSLYASPSHLTGTGTINTHGLVSDVQSRI